MANTEAIALRKLQTLNFVPKFIGLTFNGSGILMKKFPVHTITLSEYLQQKTNINCKKILRNLTQLVSRIHGLGISHGNLTIPGNILIDPKTEKLYLIDFGSSQQVTSNIESYIQNIKAIKFWKEILKE